MNMQFAKSMTRQRQAGFTLIELLLAMGLGVIVIGAVLQIFVTTRNLYQVQQETSSLQESASFAATFLSSGTSGLPVAGWYDVNNFIDSSAAFDISLQIPDFTIDQVVFGTDGDGASDSVTIRYRGDGVTMKDCMGRDVGADEWAVNTFSLSQTDGEDDYDYSLACEASLVPDDGSAASTWASQPLVTGIQDMQIIYGIDKDGDSRVDTYRDADKISNWTNVVSVRIALLLVAPGNIPMTDKNQTVLYPPWDEEELEFDDRRLRRVVTMTISLPNRI